MVFKCLFRGCKKYLLGKVSTCIARGVSRQALLYQYLLGKVSTVSPTPPHGGDDMYQYLLGKVSTDILSDFERVVAYQYLLGKVSTCLRMTKASFQKCINIY